MMILKDILIKLLLVFIIFWFPLNVSAQGNNTSQDIINNLEVKEFNSASSTEKPEDEFKCTNDFVIKVNPNKKMSIVSPNLFGVNATTYTGNYLTDSTFISHAKKLQPALVRFPGGDASNMYFFNGLPSDLPDKALTFNGEWTDFADGMKDINWKMNTEKYYAFLDSTGAKGFITVNYAYARYGTGSNPVEKAASLAA
ncbi:MAG: hypothetical protein JW798_00200, partial [Prolixibacteraceae bacterium]|nr:hypothetical protein [Prolixibacteraceae bacterium]